MAGDPDYWGELTSALRSSTSSDVAQDWLRRAPALLPHLRLTPDEIRGLMTRPIVTSEEISGKLGVVRFPLTPRVERASFSRAAPKSGQSAYLQLFLDGISADLREARADTRRRADRAFYASLGLGVVGGLALFAGCGLAFSGVLLIGVASAVGGAVSGLFSSVFAKLYTRENEDLRQMVGDLRRIEETRIGLWLADHINEPSRRDEAIQALISQVRGTQPVAFE